MSWQGNHVAAVADRMGGVLIRHEDGSEIYLQPGDDAGELLAVLEGVNITPENLDALLCDYLEGIEPT